MRPLRRREVALVGLLALALAAASTRWLRTPATPLAAAPALHGRAPAPDLPRIDLARLARERSEAPVGRRDLFDFGATPVTEVSPTPTPAPPVAPSTPPARLAPTTPSLPPLNLKYIGALESGPGLRVAVLLTDRNELLTGQAGEVLANRYRIVKIGFESVDLQEVTSGETRRVPLRGN